MRKFFHTDHLPEFKNPVITIGTFDGVHEGHREILKSVADEAQRVNGESLLLTFEPHPRKLLFPEQSLQLLTTLDEKLALVAKEGIDNTIVVPFTKEFSQFSAKEYVQEFLVKKFHPHTIIIGYDHHFGHDRSGDINLLQSLKTELHFEVKEIPAHLISSAAVSSTQVRKALQAGKVSEAALLLGRRYQLCGNVGHGAQLGRTIGFPTANITVTDADKLIPAIGIYAVYVAHGGTRYRGMLSIGTNPTVTDTLSIKIEVNIFDFSKDIYGDEITLEFVEWLRPELKFNSLEELTRQLYEDQRQSLQIL